MRHPDAKDHLLGNSGSERRDEDEQTTDGKAYTAYRYHTVGKARLEGVSFNIASHD